MVLIPIRAPLLSLCITIISVITELAFLTAAVSFLRYRACRRLQKKERVTVRIQHRYVIFITLFAMLTFVIVETITSIFSEPQVRQVTEIQPCVRNVLGANVDEDDVRSEAIHFACTNIDGTTIAHFEGNLSSSSSTITCAPRPIYNYTIGKEEILPTAGANVACAFRLCAFVMLKNDTLYISRTAERTDQTARFLPTFMNLEDIPKLNVTLIARKVADVYELPITEEGDVRRRALLGVVSDFCPFTRDDGPATSIPLGVIIGACVVWASSLLFFIASLFFRRRIFFDITHPMHWARKVRHDRGRATGNDPELEMFKAGGKTLITVTGYVRDRGDD